MVAQKSLTKPSISIAIPVFNQARTISTTIESALQSSQGQANVEIVVCDNHSNDGTANLVAKFDGSVRIVQPPHHLSMAANWNYAVKCCSSDWVGMLSGDDRIYPSYIPALRKAIALDSHAVFAMGGWENFNAKTGAKTVRRVLSLSAVTPPHKALKALLYGSKASFSAYCFLKSAFQEICGFDESYHLAQDWILQFRLASIGSFVKSDKVVAAYLVGSHDSSIRISRMPLWIADLAMFCAHTIWEAKNHGIEQSVIVDACERHLASVHRNYGSFIESDQQSLQLLGPAYERLGRERIAGLVEDDQTGVMDHAKRHIRLLVENLIPY